jgi:hypothetical protein
VALVLGLASSALAADYPKIELSTKKLKMTVYPPDAEKGFYRGSRFCWGGVMGDIEFGGFKLFHAWKDKHDPTNNDDIIGPVIEFGNDMALGYAEAKEGETFVKIGVGELVKPKEAKYSFFTNYKVANPGIWKVLHRKKLGVEQEAMEFRQTVTSKSGFSYHFIITLRMADYSMGPEEADIETQLFVKYELINVGSKKIQTDVYNHNFFNVDKNPIGPGYGIIFANELEPAMGSTFGDRAKFVDNKIEFPKQLQKEAAFGRVVDTFDKVPCESSYVMRYNNGTKFVRVQVIDSITRRKKFQVWAIGTVMCPEPFHDVTVDPGDAAVWDSTYIFTTGNVKK